MSYGTSREERIRELPGLISAACGAVVKTRLVEAKARESLEEAEANVHREADRHTLLVNELADLAMQPSSGGTKP